MNYLFNKFGSRKSNSKLLVNSEATVYFSLEKRMVSNCDEYPGICISFLVVIWGLLAYCLWNYWRLLLNWRANTLVIIIKMSKCIKNVLNLQRLKIFYFLHRIINNQYNPLNLFYSDFQRSFILCSFFHFHYYCVSI